MNEFSVQPTRVLLDGLGRPDEKLKIIHVAGTNGKGSTAEYFTRILVAAGKRTGTFTSPQVYSFYDQFKIDGVPISPETYEKYRVTSDFASEFERMTATALSAFAGEGCEWAVIECGMGGKNDATNAIKKKELAVITSISLEHTAYLGNTIAKICEQKAGIIRDCPAIINAYQCEEARRFFKGHKFADGVERTDGGFLYGGKRFALGAEGCLQPYNAACAIEGARMLGIDERAIFEGVAACKPLGRTERFQVNGRTFILDGAHNPAAFEPLGEYMLSRNVRRTVVFGCLSDKDADGNLARLIADKIIAVPCPSPRTRSAEDIAKLCRGRFKDVSIAESVSAALARADTEEVIACGSFTLLEEAKKWIEKRL